MEKYKQLKINNIIILYNIITIIKYLIIKQDILYIDFIYDYIIINIFIYILIKVFNINWKQYQKEERKEVKKWTNI